MYTLYFVYCISNYVLIFQVLGKLIKLATKEGQLLNKLHFQMHIYSLTVSTTNTYVYM